MIYNDGFKMDDNFRAIECPQCGNEEFSDDAVFCRICGSTLYNSCEGEDIFDYSGNFDHHETHNNPGNARFCESCGKKTAFYTLKYLKPYTEFSNQSVERFLQVETAATESESQNVFSPVDEDELPF